MEANKRRCRQQALALFYTSEDVLNEKLCRTATKKNIPQQTKKLSERVKFSTPQKLQKPVKNRTNLVWPTAVFSDSKLKSVKNCFEASEPWYRYENDVMENMQENGNDLVTNNSPVSTEKQLSAGPVKPKKRSVINKRRLFTSDPNDWFRHEHHEQDLNECIFKNEGTLDSDVSCDESLKINGMNEHTAASMEAEILANKQRMESDNWFDYEANLKWPFHFPVTNMGSPDVVSNRQKNQGTEMKLLLTSPNFLN